MLLYIIKSTLILGILLAVYHLFLEKEKMHQFNRFYLLSGLVLAFITPLITVGAVDPVAAQSFIASAPTLIQEVQTDIIYETEKGMDWLQFIFCGYGLITIIMLLRFVNNIGILLFKAWNNPKVNHDGHKIVVLDSPCLPHTFLKYIFINRSDYESGDIDPTLFIHEFAHAEQRHSLDIIMIELISALYWFNPLVYLYKKAIQLNHEFLADEAVVRSTNHVPEYQHLLLSKASSTEQVYMASNLNFSVTKKRLMMMTKPISKRRNVIYGLMIIPLAVFLVSCFGDYDAVPTEKSTYVDYINPEQFSADFAGKTQAELDGIKKELEQEGIDIEYKETTFNDDLALTELRVGINFNNGTNIVNGWSANPDSDAQPNPYGLWMNRTTGDYGTGSISMEYSTEKSKLYNLMTKDRDSGAKYFVEEKEVNYDEAIEWLEKTYLWQSHRVCEDLATGVISYKLNKPDSSDKVPKEKRITLEESIKIKADYFGDASIVIDNNGQQIVYKNFSKLGDTDKARIPLPPPVPNSNGSSDIDPIVAKVVVYDVAQNSIYTHKYKDGGIEVPLLPPPPPPPPIAPAR